jgi:hypothetical protein
MKKFSKINENRLDLIKDILLEIDIINGVEKFYYGDINPSAIEVNIFFKSVPKKNNSFVFDRDKIEMLSEIFSVIQRLNDVGANSYITYLATNSKHMVFRIEK